MSIASVTDTILLGVVALSSLLALSIAVLIYKRNSRSYLHRSAAVFLIFATLWSSIVNIQSVGQSVEFNTWVVRLTFVAAVVMVFAMFRFVLSASSVTSSRALSTVTYLVTASMVALALSPWVVSTVSISETITPSRAAGYYVVIAYIVSFCIANITILAVARTKRARRRVRNQLNMILVGISLGIVAGSLTNIVLPNVLHSIAPARYAWISIVIWTTLLIYTVIKQRFLDIRLAAVRTMAYLLSLVTLSLVYYFLAVTLSGVFHISASISPLAIALAIALAFLFQPIKAFFDRLTNRIFYRENYDSTLFLTSVSRVLARESELMGILKNMSTLVTDTLRVEYTAFIVSNMDAYVVVDSSSTRNFNERDAAAIYDFLIDNNGAVVTPSYVESVNKTTSRLLSRKKVGVCLPLRREDKVVGAIVLGEHRSRGLTDRDIRLVRSISEELSVAIENALSLRQISDLNATLEKRIETATRELRSSNEELKALDETKDEFISMASHQLRTPLTSIKGYISMVLDGDVGEVNEQQRKLLGEAFMSSERMVHLIGDFLNVSRLQTGKFIIDRVPTDLATLVEEEVTSMQTTAASHDMTLVYKKPRNIPTLSLDGDKIRQVIMNFIDNAIFYSRPKSTIVVKLMRHDSNVVLEVHDQGIGVPAAAQKRLFTKFFRADNAQRQRPDGTGIGLFLAKKVITSQGGKMVFESTEGKGSMFGFTLPIRKKTPRA